MNLNHLAVFHAVAEQGGIVRGAERLHITQPAVSRQIKELEASVGMPLFDRLGRGVRLTDAGEMLAGYARRLFAVEAEAERAIAEWKGLERGKLSLGASTTIGIYLLPELLGAFRRDFPGIDLHLEIGNTEAVQQRVLENTLDMGLIEGAVNHAELEATVFLEDEMVAIVPPEHPLLTAKSGTVNALRFCKEPFLIREAGSGTREVVERALAQHGLTVSNIVMSMGSTEAIKRGVAAGIGVAIVSRLTLGLEIRAGTLAILPLANLRIRRPLYLIRLRGKSESQASRAFLRRLDQKGTPFPEITSPA